MSSDRPAIQTIRLGTRGSPLALRQAGSIRDLLQARFPGLRCDLVEIRTAGDRFPDRDFRDIGVGVFTKEVDLAVLEGRADIAVHSLKDLPSDIPAGLALAAVPERESPLDAWISPAGIPLERLPAGARVGTSSPRRRAQLLHRRPDLEVQALRGNVDTRLRKIPELGLAGTVLAHAGLRRLGREERITSLVPPEWILPAVGQGALGIVARGDRADLLSALRALDHAPSRLRVEAERAFLRRLGGGCQVPAAALAEIEDGGDALRLAALVADPDGAALVRGEARGAARDGERLGRELAGDLLGRGGAAILERIRGAGAVPPGGEDR